ncbi:hypothetical protein F949_01636 [Acinetobacter junii NIPH 182]|uniref:hypothetical protein n=1 Tax=Acinetobacter junii TaxID=40215 RepID=UPI0002CF31D0|nr:hypothetical protein [Acinetobacter junii]ENV64247.1 hypothetical protein F949_01636 [Acinetobacter junii NIPH 182]
MSDTLVKLIEILLNRKDKFKKADERYERRIEFFSKVKLINEDETLSPEIRKALLDSAAQKLTGSPRGGYEIVEYFINTKKFINFEIVAPSVWFWDESIEKVYDQNQKLIDIKLNEKGYKKEKNYLGFTVFFFFSITIFLMLSANNLINFIDANLYIGKQILGVFMVFIILFFFVATTIMGILFLTHKELPDLLSKK